MGRFRYQSAFLILAVSVAAVVFAVAAVAQSTFKVDVKLVRLLVSVKDARGRAGRIARETRLHRLR